MGTKLCFASVYHPQSNGAVERANGIIFSRIKKNITEQPKGKWVDKLPKVIWYILLLIYADDTILIMEADLPQILHLKYILALFSESTGLQVNYHKSSMVPVNVLNNKMQDLAAAFGCQIASMPFTYLGLLMGTTKPRLEDLTPLMDRIERKLVSCSNFLSYSGRLQMINSAIMPITTYAMCSIKLPVGVIDNIDRVRNLSSREDLGSLISGSRMKHFY